MPRPFTAKLLADRILSPLRAAGTLVALTLPLASHIAPAHAQSAPDTMIVFDGSGSMWGQIDGRTKIEIARDTLSSVLSEGMSDQRMGMIAYGHRRKGQCSDIETVVPVGPAQMTVPAMLDAARRMSPKGKTPLTDAVRLAAGELRFTENAATVILVTDGIETCDADPCALARELEAAGIDFTAHVVGFGLSAEEGRQVQCLADNTGGLYIQASDAGQLGDALRRTIAPVEVSEDDFVDPVPATREVHFLLRDTDGADLLGIRQLEALLETTEGAQVASEAFALNYPEASARSATGQLEPGDYRLLIRRDTKSSGGYRTAFDFTVPPGEGVHVVEGTLSGALAINAFINPAMPFDPADPPPSAIKGKAWAYFHVFPVEDGVVADEPVATGYDKLRFPLPAGQYLIRANLARTLAAEKLVEVGAGAPTEVDFSFDATRVFVDAREADGIPVKRQTTYFYDKVPEGRNHFASGGGAGNGGPVPFYLPTGTWAVSAGGEGYGERRSQLLVDVPGDFADIRLKVGEGERLPADAAARITPCLEMVKVRYTGCLTQRANLGGGTMNGAPPPEPIPGDETMPGDAPEGAGPFQGTWNTQHGQVALRQEGVRVYGDYLGRSGMIVGRMQEDGRTLRGIFIYPGGSRWGGVEWRLSSDGTSLAGGWADGAPADAARGNWNGTARSADAPTLVHFPTLDENWWGGVDAARRQAIEDWAGGPLPIASDMAAMPRDAAMPGDPAASGDDPSGMPSELAGLAGTAYAFRNPADAITLHMVIDDASEAATIVLSDGWCGVPACKGDRASVHRDRLSILEENGTRSSGFGANSYQIDISSFGERKIVHVSGQGASRVRFELFDRIVLGNAERAANEAAPNGDSTDGNGADGLRLAYKDRLGDRALALVEGDGNGGATLTLLEKWCAFPECQPDTLAIGAPMLDAIASGREQAFEVGRYTLTTAPGSFEYLLGIKLQRPNGRTTGVMLKAMEAAETEAAFGGGGEAPAPPPASERVVGVFTLDDSGAPLERIVSDYLHLQTCQRRPVVFYPDGEIAFKAFKEPQTAEDNPYSGALSRASCEIAGNRYTCTWTRPDGSEEPLNFTTRALGEGHFELCRDGEGCSIAAACFHPGGQLFAGDIMPNGKALGNLMAERPDGGEPGFFFNVENRAEAR